MQTSYLISLFTWLLSFQINFFFNASSAELVNEHPTLIQFKSVNDSKATVVKSLSKDKKHFVENKNLQTVTVNTKNGRIVGQILHVEGKKMNVFTSIRFGKPPVGKRRFRKPEPVDSWKGEYDATVQRSICYQTRGLFGGEQFKESEDCLFINIWSADLTKRQPVMFWIYGGGFANGYSNEGPDPRFNGSVLATFGVVVVTFNYRVGNLGFYYNATEEAPGNVGLHDQVLALKWVKKNICHFGGDPKKITIFGESAGSGSVSFHLTSPLSQRLFQKAIMQSGSAYSNHGILMDPKFFLKISRSLAKETGCLNNDWTECLRRVDPVTLMKTEIVSTPIVGDDFNPEPGQIKRMRNKQFNADLLLIVGFNDDEGSLMLEQILTNVTITKKNINKIIKRAMTESVSSRVHYNIYEPSSDKIYDYYFKNLSEKDWSNQNLLKHLVATFYGEAIFVCPGEFQTDDFVRLKDNGKLYRYLMTYESKTLDKMGCNQTWQGVCHADDIPFLFGHPIRHRNDFNEDDYQMSLLFNYLWSDFAKTGEPFSSPPPKNMKIPGNKKWPTFDREKSQNKFLDLNPTKIKLIDDPFEKDCFNFWKKYFN